MCTSYAAKIPFVVILMTTILVFTARGQAGSGEANPNEYDDNPARVCYAECPPPDFECVWPNHYNDLNCTCEPPFYSPIVIDILGDGFSLTSTNQGVQFDLNGDEAREHLSWTSTGSDDAWLVLDRDGNGRIESGKEMFGNFTPQPKSADPNGFIALAEYDKTANGGNGDGMIDDKDAIFTSLRLWQDVNHNGISEPNELHLLASLDVMSVSLSYKESKRTDEYGNQFKYRSHVKDTKGAKVGRWAWDVFLIRG